MFVMVGFNNLTLSNFKTNVKNLTGAPAAPIS